MDKNTVEAMVKNLPAFKNERHDSYDKRRLSIHFSDGYDSKTNRTAFFAVEGSPNRLIGWVEEWDEGYKMTYRNKQQVKTVMIER